MPVSGSLRRDPSLVIGIAAREASTSAHRESRKALAHMASVAKARASQLGSPRPHIPRRKTPLWCF